MTVVVHRQTFLRRHVSQELADTRDVLALAELMNRAPAARLSLESFFYEGLPDLGALYDPVRLRPLAPRDRELVTAYFRAALPGQQPLDWPTLDLTYFLLALAAAQIRAASCSMPAAAPAKRSLAWRLSATASSAPGCRALDLFRPAPGRLPAPRLPPPKGRRGGSGRPAPATWTA